jgi:maltose-binding protein MalE
MIRGTPGMPDIEVHSNIFLRKGDNLIGQIAGSHLGFFRDSLMNRTRDTLVFIDGDTLLIKPFVPKEVYRVSPYVFTAKYGNIHVSLPDAPQKHYTVKFFDDTNKLLFELSEIKDPSLILDKTNFQHSGWFRFELYESGQLKEKNKLFIPLDAR